MKLNAKQVAAIRQPGRFADGSGLYLQVTATGSRSWLLRYERAGRERMLGLGPYPLVGLADARERASRARLMLLDGIDPVDAKKAGRAAKAVKVMTFKAASKQYYELHKDKWSPKHPFLDSLETYAFPIIGNADVRTISTSDVLRIVQPEWAVKNETMSKLRGRVAAVFAWCIASGHRQTNNPATWKGLLDAILPRPGKVRKVEHHAALPYVEIADFMAELRALEGTACRALEMTILCATRTGETLGARWSEISLEEGVWSIPASRTKTGEALRVPLSAPALDLLRALPVEDGNPFVFIGRSSGAGLGSTSMMDVLRQMRPGITVHGFRSCFRDWAADATSHDNIVCEKALGHAISNETEKAYRRGDLFEKRVALMNDWARFCDGGVATGNVVPMMRAATGG